MSLPVLIIKSVFLCCFMLLAVVGNVCVIYVVCRFKKLKTIPNYFVANLAVADLLFALTGMPMILVTTISEKWILGDVLCDIGGFLNSFFCVASIWTLAMISVNRFFAVAKARTIKDIYTKKRTILILVFVWIWAGLVAVPPLFGWSRFKPGDNFCTIDGAKDLSYSVLLAVVAYFIPLVLLTGLYCKIFFMLWDHQKNLRLGRPTNYTPAESAENESSMNYSDTDSMDSTSEYGAVKEPSEKGWSILSKFTRKNKSYDSCAKTLPVAYSAGENEKVEVIEQNGNHSGATPMLPPAIKSNCKQDLSTDPVVSTSMSALPPRLQEASSNGNRSPTVSFRDSKESIESRERSARTISKKDSGLTLNTKKRKRSTIRRLFQEVRVTKMLFTVVLMFFLCWTPFMVGSILYAFDAAPENFEILTFAIMCACLNSVCNPIIYALMNRNFRAAFLELRKRVCPCFS